MYILDGTLKYVYPLSQNAAFFARTWITIWRKKIFYKEWSKNFKNFMCTYFQQVALCFSNSSITFMEAICGLTGYSEQENNI